MGQQALPFFIVLTLRSGNYMEGCTVSLLSSHTPRATEP